LLIEWYPWSSLISHFPIPNPNGTGTGIQLPAHFPQGSLSSFSLFYYIIVLCFGLCPFRLFPIKGIWNLFNFIFFMSEYQFVN
jgi:hypothetical protein